MYMRKKDNGSPGKRSGNRGEERRRLIAEHPSQGGASEGEGLERETRREIEKKGGKGYWNLHPSGGKQPSWTGTLPKIEKQGEKSRAETKWNEQGQANSCSGS